MDTYRRTAIAALAATVVLGTAGFAIASSAQAGDQGTSTPSAVVTPESSDDGPNHDASDDHPRLAPSSETPGLPEVEDQVGEVGQVGNDDSPGHDVNNNDNQGDDTQGDNQGDDNQGDDTQGDTQGDNQGDDKQQGDDNHDDGGSHEN